MIVSSTSAVAVEDVIAATHGGYNVAVDVQGDCHAALAEEVGHPLGNPLRMLTPYKMYSGTRVPKIVEPYPGQRA